MRILSAFTFVLLCSNAASAAPTAEPEAKEIDEATAATRTEPRRRVALFAGYGADTLFALEFGLGLRGGTLLGSSRFYTGASLVHHRGTNDEGSNARVGDYHYLDRFSYGTVDFGYELQVGSFAAMPFLGVGVGWLESEECEGGECYDGTDPAWGLAVTPGLSVHGVYRRVFAGADVRWIYSTVGSESDDTTSTLSGLAAYGLVGLRF